MMANLSSKTTFKQLSKVSVIGAGVIGLSVATHLLERFPNDVQVTIIADKFSPHTISSDKSGGYIFPPSNFTTIYPSDPNKVEKWFKSTMEKFKYIFYSEEKTKTGISLTSGYSSEICSQKWSHLVYDHVELVGDSQFSEFNYKSELPLMHFTTFIVPCPVYLPWLRNRFISLGGKSEERKIHQLSDLSSEYDIVINCTGLGARELVNDQQVYPVTGHIVSVEAPWIKQFHVKKHDSDESITTYIFPRTNEVILGGTYEQGMIDISNTTVHSIIDRCSKLVPSLMEAKVKESWSGIRPYRQGGVRLEKEEKQDFVLIHCYGHGGDGVSLSWGCAEEVGALVEQILT